MKNNLKILEAERYTLEIITQNTKQKRDLFTQYSDETKYSLWVEYLENIKQKIAKEIDACPIGYQYTGTFYFRKPYSATYEVVKVDGTAFMRHDLVSWAIKSDTTDLSSYGYFRNLFKDENCREALTKEDTVPLFKKCCLN